MLLGLHMCGQNCSITNSTYLLVKKKNLNLE